MSELNYSQEDYLVADEEGDYPIHVIAGLSKCHVSGTVADLRKLLKTVPRFDVNTKNKLGQTALHLAARCGKPAMVSLLLEKGAEVDALDSDGRTPIYEAIRGSNKSIALLLKAKAKLNIVDSAGYTPLSLACSIGKVGAVELLCKKRLNMKLENSRPKALTLLVLQSDSATFSSNSIAMLRALIKKGMKVNNVDPDSGENEAGLLVDHMQYLRGRSDDMLTPVKTLIRAGCDPWHRNRKGFSVLDRLDDEQIATLGPSIKALVKGREEHFLIKVKSANDVKGFFASQQRYSLAEVQDQAIHAQNREQGRLIDPKEPLIKSIVPATRSLRALGKARGTRFGHSK